MVHLSFTHPAASIAGVLMLLVGVAPLCSAEPPQQAIVDAAQPDLPEVAKGLPRGGRLRVQGIAIESETADALDLSRFRVFSSDAQIVVDNAYSLPPPEHAYYRGTVEGDPDSVAVLAIPESGDPEGLILGPKGIWKIEKRKGPAAASLKARKLKQDELAPLKDFRCATDGLGLAPKALLGGAEGSPQAAPATEAAVVAYTARVAVETDYEFYSKFNNADAAASYVGALFAYVSSIYEAETGTSLNVSFLRLWTGGATSDPWNATSDTSTVLNEFANYWNANETGRDRTIVHMLSGKGLGGGIAYIGVLCNKSSGYGLSTSLSKTTLITTQTVWDTLVVAHEIGHNFNSPHTHSYCNVGGSAFPVDECAPSSYGGACDGVSSQLPCATPGAGCGTIMSYCHLLSGGYGNIKMTFGLGHPYGVLPDRVPQRMAAHVQSRAQSYPACLSPIGDSTSSLVIGDVTQAEGNAGTTAFNFTVSLTPANADTVTVSFATANGTATAGSDYTAASGTLTFTPGQTSKAVTVNVTGDTVVEPDETFFVNLSAASGATISDGQGVGTITNDDVQSAPDLLVTGITLTPASPPVNGTFSAAITVMNQGGVSGNGGYLKVWADQAATQTCYGTGYNTLVSVGTLAAGASKTLTVNLAGQSAGNKTLRAFVDGFCQTTEIDETNNQAALAYTVGSGKTTPDFIVTGITLTPSSPPANGTFSAAVTVKNQGAAAGTVGTLQVWANQASAQSCGASGDQSASLGSLAAGASTKVTVNNLPAGAAGSKTLRAFVDSGCQTAESDETNNQATQAYSVGTSGTAPDFLVTDITLTPASPPVNGTFSAAITVMNQGGMSGNGGYLKVWADQAATQTCYGTGYNTLVSVGTLAAGASKTLTANLAGQSAGNKTLRAFVDGFCQTTESDETNNQSTLAYTKG